MIRARTLTHIRRTVKITSTDPAGRGGGIARSVPDKEVRHFLSYALEGQVRVTGKISTNVQRSLDSAPTASVEIPLDPTLGKHCHFNSYTFRLPCP